MTEGHGVVQKAEGGHRLSFRRPYATIPDDLWEAMTSPPRVGRWLADLTGDLRVPQTREPKVIGRAFHG